MYVINAWMSLSVMGDMFHIIQKKAIGEKIKPLKIILNVCMGLV